MLIPAAREYVITKKNAADIKAKLLLKLQMPQFLMMLILSCLRIIVILIFLNSGGVAVSYFEGAKT